MKPNRFQVVAAVIAASISSVHAADYVKGYTRGSASQLLSGGGGKGSVLFVDEAATGNADQSADGGNPLWGWEIDGSSTIAPRSTGGLRGGIREDPPDKVLYMGVDDIDEVD